MKAKTGPHQHRRTARPAAGQTVKETTPKRPRRVLINLDKAIVPSRGKPFDLTNEQIHDLIEFP